MSHLNSISNLAKFNAFLLWLKHRLKKFFKTFFFPRTAGLCFQLMAVKNYILLRLVFDGASYFNTTALINDFTVTPIIIAISFQVFTHKKCRVKKLTLYSKFHFLLFQNKHHLGIWQPIINSFAIFLEIYDWIVFWVYRVRTWTLLDTLSTSIYDLVLLHM